MYVRYYKINNEDALIIVTISFLSLSILINVLHRIRSFSLSIWTVSVLFGKVEVFGTVRLFFL